MKFNSSENVEEYAAFIERRFGGAAGNNKRAGKTSGVWRLRLLVVVASLTNCFSRQLSTRLTWFQIRVTRRGNLLIFTQWWITPKNISTEKLLRCQKLDDYKVHSVWKLLKMSHLNFSILASFTNFCPIKSDLSGNTVWPQVSGFQKLAKLDHFGIFH